MLSGGFPSQNKNRVPPKCTGKWQKPVSPNSYLTVWFFFFFNHHLWNLSSTLTKRKLATWEKVNFLWWEGKGWGTVYIGKEKKSLKSMLKNHTTTYFLLTLNYFCVYAWGYSLCLDLKCTSGGDFKKSFKIPVFSQQVQLFLCLLWLSISSFWLYFQLLQLQ